MTLDPTIAALIKATAHLPRLADIPIAAARKGFLARIALLPPVTEPLQSITNLRLPSGLGHEIPARLYQPLAQPLNEQSPPLLLYFHGGGFALGNLDSHDGLCRRLCARSGHAVLAVDYRLAPEHPYPAALEDCWVALNWATAHTETLGVSASLAIAGDSAGGTLAAGVALRWRDQNRPALSAQALLYPMVDHYSTGTASYREMAEGYGLTLDAMTYFLERYFSSATDHAHPYALPLRAASHAGLPPTLVITAQYDVLRDEAEAYAAALTTAGVQVQNTRYAGMNHGFMALSGLVGPADQAIQQVCDWLILHTTS